MAHPTRTRLTQIALAGLGLILVAGLANALGGRTKDAALIDSAYQRMNNINAGLALSPSPPIVIAGDSHAAALAREPWCGEPVIAGGVGGATTAIYDDAWKRIETIRPARAIVLVIGTNDQQTRRDPQTSRQQRAYRTSMKGLVERMARQTDTLVVIAIPPTAHAKVDQHGVRSKNRWLADLCQRTGCRLLDPFADAREGDGETLKAGLAADGAHFDDYSPIRNAISRMVCPVRTLAEQDKKTSP